MAELVQDREVAPVHHANQDRPVVYVLANAKDRARDWARQNKPNHLAKCFSSAVEWAPRGLHLLDIPVFVLDEIPLHVRQAWQSTGCKLVYL